MSWLIVLCCFFIFCLLPLRVMQHQEVSQWLLGLVDAPTWPTGPTRTLLPLLTGCTLLDLRPATPTPTLLHQVGAVMICHYHLDFSIQISFKSCERVHCSWSTLHLCAPAIQVDSTPTLQRSMLLRPTYLRLLILLLWASSPHMTQTSPPQQQVRLWQRGSD